MCRSVDNNYYNLLPLNQEPTVGVSINQFFVEQVASRRLNSTAYYSDYLAFSTPAQEEGDDGGSSSSSSSTLDDNNSGPLVVQSSSQTAADPNPPHFITICLLPFQGNPYINSLQILPVVSHDKGRQEGTKTTHGMWEKIAKHGIPHRGICWCKMSNSRFESSPTSTCLLE